MTPPSGRERGAGLIGLDVALAAQAGQLDLNVMTPLSAFNLLHVGSAFANFLPVFARRGVADLWGRHAAPSLARPRDLRVHTWRSDHRF